MHDDGVIIKWYNGYQKRKTQKAKRKEELMPIAWHPSRWWDWYVSDDEKKETEKLIRKSRIGLLIRKSKIGLRGHI